MSKFVSAISMATALMLGTTAFGAVGFTVSGSNLVDANGNTFIPRGVSNPHIWFDTDAYNALPNLAAKRVNIVRIVWSTSGSISRLDQIMSRCEALGLVPMPELHDVTGSDSASALNTCAQYFANNASVFKNHARYVLINIANEWGNTSTDAQWASAYQTAISTIRNSGIVTTLVIDGHSWGQNATGAENYGQSLLNYDPQHNLLFSVHMYGSWNNAADINTAMSTMKSKNLPFVVGEFGWNYNNGSNNLGCKVNDTALMQYANQYGYGYLAWSTKGNDSANAWLDLTTDWNTPTSPWGNDVFYGTYGIYNTAHQASVFSTSSGSFPANGTYKIVNRNSGLALDAYNNGTANGTKVEQWAYNGGNNQRWTLTNQGNNQYNIVGVGSGKCLDVTGVNSANGTLVELYTYGGGTNQKWTFGATSGGYYRVTPVFATGSCLEIYGNSTANGGQADIWSYNGGNNQQWSFSAP